jgi:hypothetical protein
MSGQPPALAGPVEPEEVPMSVRSRLRSLPLLTAAIPFCLVVATSATAQTLPVDPGRVREAVRDLPLPPLSMDQPEPDGPVWARGRDYKARFDATGWQFSCRTNAEVPAVPVHFAAVGCSIAGVPLPCEPAVPVQDGNWITYEHGAVRQLLEAREAGIEQIFVIDRLPGRGALQLSLAVKSELQAEDLGEGVRFTGPQQAVHYGEAVAIDADGRRCAAPTAWRSGRIEIDVPAAFVATARLPLLIDPLVAAVPFASTSAANVYTDGHDIVWDASSQRYVVVYEIVFSDGDHDVFAYRLDADFNFLSGIVIDTSTAMWERPRVAYLAYGAQCLCVAQVGSGPGSTTRTIRARAFNNGAVGSAFDIEVPGVPGHLPGDKRSPDVCGDSNPVGPTFYTVVWENQTAAGIDIHMKQVAQTNALVNAAPTQLTASIAIERTPSISKSYGPAPVAAQFAVVAWESRLPGSTHSDIRQIVLSPTGAILVGETVVDGSGNNDVRPAVSSPSLGLPAAPVGQQQRRVMIAWERRNGGAPDIVARVVDPLTGTGSIATNLTALDTPLAAQGAIQEHAEVDCDGYLFTVVFHEVAPAATGSLDVRASTFQLDPNGALALESTAVVQNSARVERAPYIASRYSSSGVPDTRHGLFWIVTGASPQLWGGNYVSSDAAGGFTIYPSGCGALSISAFGSTRIGESFTVASGAASGLPGFVFGNPFSLYLPQCPNCEIGVDGVLVGGSTLALQIPPLLSLLGVVVSTQAFTFDASGPCLGNLTLSATIDAELYW